MASTSKAALIEQANQLRRNADTLRKANYDGFRQHVVDLTMALRATGMTSAEVDELLPAALMRPPDAFRLTPLHDFVAVKPADPKKVTEGGILIPESAEEVPMRGIVLAVGPGRIEPGIGTVLPSVKVGNDVLFGRYAGVEVTIDKDTIRIMREEDILGVLAPEQETA